MPLSLLCAIHSMNIRVFHHLSIGFSENFDVCWAWHEVIASILNDALIALFTSNCFLKFSFGTDSRTLAECEKLTIIKVDLNTRGDRMQIGSIVSSIYSRAFFGGRFHRTKFAVLLDQLAFSKSSLRPIYFLKH